MKDVFFWVLRFSTVIVIIGMTCFLLIYISVIGPTKSNNGYLTANVPTIDKLVKGERVTLMQIDQLLNPSKDCTIGMEEAIARWCFLNRIPELDKDKAVKKIVTAIKTINCRLDQPVDLSKELKPGPLPPDIPSDPPDMIEATSNSPN
jgi:hypothetical protein